MPSSVVPIKSRRIDLPSGEWIEVKERLNHGESTDFMERCYRFNDDGTLTRIPWRFTDAMIAAYLLDWSLTGLDDQPLRIKGMPSTDIEQALRMLYQERFSEIQTAIEAHVAALTRELAEKKRAPIGGGGSSVISPLPADAIGVTSG